MLILNSKSERDKRVLRVKEEEKRREERGRSRPFA
jgi:hypothetical protein